VDVATSGPRKQRAARSVATLFSRLYRGQKGPTVINFGLAQATVFATSLARIPLIVTALGASGYGLVLAIGSILPWPILIATSFTSTARLRTAEAIGMNDSHRADGLVVRLTQQASSTGVLILLIGVLLAFTIPWPALLQSTQMASNNEVRLGVVIVAIFAGSACIGAVHQGYLQANNRVALTAAFSGIAAILSLLVTIAAYLLNLPLPAFIVASSIAMCAPFWLSTAFVPRHLRGVRFRRATPTGEVKGLPVKEFIVMSGVSAPPILVSGFDAIILSAASGPGAVATYGIATRLAVLVTLVPAALYPVFWADFARQRASFPVDAMRKTVMRGLMPMLVITAIAASLFVFIGPQAAKFLTTGQVQSHPGLFIAIGAAALLATCQTVLLPALAGHHRAARLLAIIVYGSILPNVALSYLLARDLGAIGPVLSTILFSSLLVSTSVALIVKRPEMLVTLHVDKQLSSRIRER
jgi:O-antigen/teichoic acid export membrane protein